MTTIHIESFRERARIDVCRPLTLSRKMLVALGCGFAGVLALALPIVVYDSVSAAHGSLALFMAPTAWLFGLNHFAQTGYLWWPIVVGLLIVLLCAALQGAVFGGLADRFLDLRTLPEALGVGLGWGFASWLLFWYTLLPIARGGAPFHATAAVIPFATPLFVAPIWVFVLGFALLGVVTSLTYLMLRKT